MGVRLRHKSQLMLPGIAQRLSFVNQVSWAHSHTHCLYIIYDCFPSTRAELNSCDREYVACEDENIYYLALYRKIFQILGKIMVLSETQWKKRVPRAVSLWSYRQRPGDDSCPLE